VGVRVSHFIPPSQIRNSRSIELLRLSFVFGENLIAHPKDIQIDSGNIPERLSHRTAKVSAKTKDANRDEGLSGAEKKKGSMLLSTPVCCY
jgi:hypothetical protein